MTRQNSLLLETALALSSQRPRPFSLWQDSLLMPNTLYRSQQLRPLELIPTGSGPVPLHVNTWMLSERWWLLELTKALSTHLLTHTHTQRHGQ